MSGSELSRYEINRLVNAILVRHAVDRTSLQFSSTERSTYLYGYLRKEDGHEFSVESIKGLIHEISQIPQLTFVQADLDNWVISTKGGSWFIEKKKLPQVPISFFKK